MTRAPAEVGSAANSYEILAKLATGGMAEIFLARGASTAGVERYVVLKRVLRHRASDVHFVEMFLDEARLAAQLQHPNIAQVYDIGKLGDSYFFTMEYVHGETVRTLLGRSHGLRQPIPVGAVLSIVAGAAAGLHHAHERKGFDGRHLGIVHRDVSPSNLMVSYEGTVKVVDFGVAKASHRSTETQSGTVKGKITYMSPEQCKGVEIDRRSDLFALGIVFWELLTSEKLFRRHSDFETMQAIVMEDVPPPSLLRTDVSPEIDRIVLRLLAKDPAQRFQSGDELHEAIETVAVRTGSVLSAASLGRYMRDLFGQRPEPWIEVQTQEIHPEAVTVTSEPIPPNLAVSPADDFDRKLAAVPALTQRLVLADDPQDRLRTEPNHESGPVRSPHESGPVRSPHESGPVRNVVPLSVGPRAHRPSVTPSGPSYPSLSSASHHAHPVLQYPVIQREPQPRRSRALYILVPAIVIGIVIGIGVGLGGSQSKPTPAEQGEHETASIEMAAAPTHAPGESPGGEPAIAPPSTEPAAPSPAEAAPARAAAPGADPAAEPSSETPTVPSATPRPEASATPTVEPPGTPTIEKPAAAAPKRPDVAAMFEAGSYRDAVTACASSRSLLAQNAITCTLAACKMKQAARARRWFAQVASARKSATARQCDEVTLEKPSKPDRPAPDDVCKRDPMACQH